jgi:hypothetical protein
MLAHLYVWVDRLVTVATFVTLVWTVSKCAAPFLRRLAEVRWNPVRWSSARIAARIDRLEKVLENPFGAVADMIMAIAMALVGMGFAGFYLAAIRLAAEPANAPAPWPGILFFLLTATGIWRAGSIADDLRSGARRLEHLTKEIDAGAGEVLAGSDSRTDHR